MVNVYFANADNYGVFLQTTKKKNMTTNNHDENWSHVRETILMINVAVARIEHAMIEGNDSFTSLSQSFVGIVKSAEKVTKEVSNLDGKSENDSINKNCKDISNQVNSSIVAFQFYDRLSQRMSLVSQTLNSLTEILSDPDKKNTQDEWSSLQNTIRSKYTLDADQEMFDAVLSGTSIEDALKKVVEKTEEDDIEFF